MFNEQLDVVGSAPERRERPMIERFAQATTRLRWSNAKLTRLVHQFAAEQRARVRLTQPNLCADLRAWVASGYRTTPSSTRQYLRQLKRIEEITRIEPEELDEEFRFGANDPGAVTIAHRLMPYEDRSDKQLSKRLARLEAQLESSSRHGLLPAALTALGPLYSPA